MSIISPIRRGAWNTISNSFIIESLADSFDFVILDLEHGFRDYSECESQIRFLLNSHTTLFVRLRSFDDIWLQSLLDLGVDKFLIPQIRKIEEVADFVSRVKYPPLGTRGFHPKSTNLSRQRHVDFAEGLQASVEIFPIIETSEALSQLESIISFEGVTGTYFGSYDLSIEIARGDRENVLIRNALAQLLHISKRHNRDVMCLGVSQEDEISLAQSGAKYIVRGIDSQMISDAFKTGISTIET